MAGLRIIDLPKLKFVQQNSLLHQQKHVDSLPGKLKVAPSSTNLGSLFGTFNTTGNYQVCSCVSEQYGDLVGSKILFSIYHFHYFLAQNLVLSSSLYFNSEGHLKVEYIPFKKIRNAWL